MKDRKPLAGAVSVNKNHRHSAFSLIELIFTIVILGITFMTLPLILSMTNESIATTLQSRAYYHGLAKMQIVTDKPWDENNTADFVNTGGIYYVVETQSDTGTLLECDGDNMRAGHYAGLNRRMCNRDSGVASVTLGVDTGEASPNFDDIDDFDGDTDTAVGTGNYILNTSVDYVAYDPSPANNTATHSSSDAASAQTTSVKRIRVQVLDSGSNEITNYYYYATNIGRPQAYIKDNP